RDSIMRDEREQLYIACWPPLVGEHGPESELAKAMIKRRRERIVLDSIQDLIRHMGAIREGRTAVITVSDGWTLFRPDNSLTKVRIDPMTGKNADPIPGMPPPVGVGPGGNLTSRLPSPDANTTSDRTECEKDQMDLAMADN